MKWNVVARPEAEDDLNRAANWYNAQRQGLGEEFIEEVIAVFDVLEISPLLHCRKFLHSSLCSADANVATPLQEDL